MIIRISITAKKNRSFHTLYFHLPLLSLHKIMLKQKTGGTFVPPVYIEKVYANFVLISDGNVHRRNCRNRSCRCILCLLFCLCAVYRLRQRSLPQVPRLRTMFPYAALLSVYAVTSFLLSFLLALSGRNSR